MNILSYVVTHDYGFAPNPYHGILSLANCKPVVRRCAKVGDMIVGTGSVKTVGNGQLVYAGIISEVVNIFEYGAELKYRDKRPTSSFPTGDAIYYRKNGTRCQRENAHHFESDVDHDTKVENVLLCGEFWYFGRDAIEIPYHLREVIKKGRGHRRIKDSQLIESFLTWIRIYKRGVVAEPFHKAKIVRCTPSKSDKKPPGCSNNITAALKPSCM